MKPKRLVFRNPEGGNKEAATTPQVEAPSATNVANLQKQHADAQERQEKIAAQEKAAEPVNIAQQILEACGIEDPLKVMELTKLIGQLQISPQDLEHYKELAQKPDFSVSDLPEKLKPLHEFIQQALSARMRAVNVGLKSKIIGSLDEIKNFAPQGKERLKKELEKLPPQKVIEWQVLFLKAKALVRQQSEKKVGFDNKLMFCYSRLLKGELLEPDLIAYLHQLENPQGSILGEMLVRMIPGVNTFKDGWEKKDGFLGLNWDALIADGVNVLSLAAMVASGGLATGAVMGMRMGALGLRMARGALIADALVTGTFAVKGSLDFYEAYQKDDKGKMALNAAMILMGILGARASWKGATRANLKNIEIGPDGARISKGVANEKVLKANAELKEVDRIKEAERLLGRKLNKQEQAGLLRAHEYEQGKNVMKGVRLRKAGFTKEEAQILMDQGIAGKWDIKGKLPSELKKYPLGTEVNIPRSNGQTTKAKIVAFDSDRRTFLVEWIENGQTYEKNIPFRSLKSVNKRRQMYQKQKIEKVSSKKELVAIGDLHGSIEHFWANLESGGLVDANHRWIGGNRKVVFHGDILADRNTDGFKILSEINKFRKQGADISIVAGNHDDFMLSFLLGRNGENGTGLAISMQGNQGKGLLELTEFSGNGRRMKNFESALNEGRLNRRQILQAMRQSERGRMLLEEICNMKLCDQVGDVLHMHIDPTMDTLEAIATHGVDAINQEFQTALRKTLLDGQPFNNERYNKLFDIFLDTKHRNIYENISSISTRNGNADHLFPAELMERIRFRGIRTIVFGHSNLGENPNLTAHGINMLGIDRGKSAFGESVAKMAVNE
ncbi:MAG: hypothetical protein K9L85_02080 [Candidatus Peribacteraceae bacterium]|nr:hypothetical protein [Candidatus Peribacteraceae bacterium]